MRFEDHVVVKQERYSIGLDRETGQFFISFPVSNGLVEYEEYYSLDEEAYRGAMTALARISDFVSECRDRKHDDILIVKPGRLRGEPI